MLFYASGSSNALPDNPNCFLLAKKKYKSWIAQVVLKIYFLLSHFNLVKLRIRVLRYGEFLDHHLVGSGLLVASLWTARLQNLVPYQHDLPNVDTHLSFMATGSMCSCDGDYLNGSTNTMVILEHFLQLPFNWLLRGCPFWGVTGSYALRVIVVRNSAGFLSMPVWGNN